MIRKDSSLSGGRVAIPGSSSGDGTSDCCATFCVHLDAWHEGTRAKHRRDGFPQPVAIVFFRLFSGRLGKSLEQRTVGIVRSLRPLHTGHHSGRIYPAAVPEGRSSCPSCSRSSQGEVRSSPASQPLGPWPWRGLPYRHPEESRARDLRCSAISPGAAMPGIDFCESCPLMVAISEVLPHAVHAAHIRRHLVHHVVGQVAVQHPVAGTIRDELHVARLGYAYQHCVSRPPGGFGMRPPSVPVTWKVYP